MKGHNSVKSSEVVGFCQRIESVQADIDALNGDKKSIYAEAKALGYDTRCIKYLVKRRKESPDDRSDNDAMRDTYMSAAGMGDHGPLFSFASRYGSDTLAQEQRVEAAGMLLSEDGELTINDGGRSIRVWRDAGGKVQFEEYDELPLPKVPVAAQAPRDVPNVAWAKVHAMGKAARAEGAGEADNPFPVDDKRHARWLSGWTAGDPGGAT